jgi:uncharacterized protein (DUF433 family)
MAESTVHPISLDDRGVAYISGTSMKVAHVAIDVERWGMTPQQIQENYPRLSLEQIHAALAYYDKHRGEIETRIAQENEEYERIRAENPNPFTREQLAERSKQRKRPVTLG